MRLALRVLACAALVVMVLAGCRESEQDRITRYEKGVYLGKADTPLSEDALRAIRGRHSRMAGTRVGGGGGGGGATASTSPAPAAPIARTTGGDLDAQLRARASKQSFN